MPANKKLTKILAGRTIQSASPGQNGKEEPVLILTLDDGSVLNVKTAPGSPVSVPAGAKLLKVREDGPSVNLDLEGGGTMGLTLANPGNGFELRDKTGKLEYNG